MTISDYIKCLHEGKTWQMPVAKSYLPTKKIKVQVIQQDNKWINAKLDKICANMKTSKHAEVLPVTFSTHNRTKCACWCLEHIIMNLKYNGGRNLFICICDDRSDAGHVEALEDVLKKQNFTAYKVFRNSTDRCGYGKLLNQALEFASSMSDVVLTVEDDRLLENKLDITPLVELLEKSAPEYAAVRVAEHDGQWKRLKQLAGMPISLRRMEGSTGYKFTYNFQCMLRHKALFQNIKFDEHLPVAKAEHALCYAYNKLTNNGTTDKLKVLQWLSSDGKPMFLHLGESTIGHRKYKTPEKYKFLFEEEAKASEPVKQQASSSNKFIMNIYVELNNKLGNHCLQIYRAFKFALMTETPFDNVFVVGKYNPLFQNIKQNFIGCQWNEKIADVDFDNVLHDASLDKMLNQSKLIKQWQEQGKTNINILFSGCNWIYPQSVEDFCLFNFLFDGNKFLVDECISKNKELFGQNLDYALVGMTVRRGDFVKLRWGVLSSRDIDAILEDIRGKYHDHVKIVITSDEIQRIESDVADKRCCFFLKDKSPEEQIAILSLCDYVINNGAYYRCEDKQVRGPESTFGQIAQILNVSSKFTLRTQYTHEYFKTQKYLNYQKETFIGLRNGSNQMIMDAHANKMAIYYSIYGLTDDVRDSMYWILKLVMNIKFYMENRIYDKIDIVVCTDDFTKSLLDKVIRQEKVDQIDEKMYREHVKYKLFGRVLNSDVGRMWRYMGLVDTSYDLVVSGEADDPMDKYFSIMNNLLGLDYALHVLKYKSQNHPSSILAGNIYMKPKLLPDGFVKDWTSFLCKLFDKYNNVPGWQDEVVSTFMLQKINEYACNGLKIGVKIITSIRFDDFWKDIESLSDEVIYLKKLMGNADVDIMLKKNYVDEFSVKTNPMLLHEYKNNDMKIYSSGERLFAHPMKWSSLSSWPSGKMCDMKFGEKSTCLLDGQQIEFKIHGVTSEVKRSNVAYQFPKLEEIFNR